MVCLLHFYVLSYVSVWALSSRQSINYVGIEVTAEIGHLNVKE